MSKKLVNRILKEKIDPAKCREILHLPEIHTKEDCIYMKLIKNDEGHFDVESWELYCPNAALYYDKEDELIDSNINCDDFDNLPIEYQFLYTEIGWHESCEEEFTEEFYNYRNFYYSNRKEDTLYLKLTDLSITYHSDYFGEVDCKVDYNIAVIDKNDIPNEILESLNSESEIEADIEIDF